MERPHGNRETPRDEYDNELTQIEADFIALSDVLLQRKNPDSLASFVDIEANQSASDLYELVQHTRLGSALLAAEDEQLAIASDGVYYPQLDVRKQGTEPTAAWIRVYGWDDLKWRVKSRDPFERVEYEDAVDKTRDIVVNFAYDIDGEYVAESLTMSGNTFGRGAVQVSTTLFMSMYFETGYDGHAGRCMRGTEDEVYELLEVVARAIDD